MIVNTTNGFVEADNGIPYFTRAEMVSEINSLLSIRNPNKWEFLDKLQVLINEENRQIHVKSRTNKQLQLTS